MIDYLDALQIVLALFTLNVFNPGRLIFGKQNDDALNGKIMAAPPTEKLQD